MAPSHWPELQQPRPLLRGSTADQAVLRFIQSLATTRNPSSPLTIGRALADAMAVASVVAWQRHRHITALGRIAGVSCRHGNLHRARTHRNIDDDGIVFEIDLVTSPVGAAEYCEHVMALVEWGSCVAAEEAVGAKIEE